MSQADALRAIDALAMAKVRATPVPGTEHVFADVAIYTPSSGIPVPDINVYVDRNVEYLGDGAQAVNRIIVVSILRDELATPAKGATLTIDDEVLVLEKEINADESMRYWRVRPQ